MDGNSQREGLSRGPLGTERDLPSHDAVDASPHVGGLDVATAIETGHTHGKFVAANGVFVSNECVMTAAHGGRVSITLRKIGCVLWLSPAAAADLAADLNEAIEQFDELLAK